MKDEKELKKLINRLVKESIATHMEQINIVNSKAESMRRGKFTERISPPPNEGAPWTAEDIYLLKAQHYQFIEGAAKALGRSRLAIRWKLFHLNLLPWRSIAVNLEDL